MEVMKLRIYKRRCRIAIFSVKGAQKRLIEHTTTKTPVIDKNIQTETLSEEFKPVFRETRF